MTSWAGEASRMLDAPPSQRREGPSSTQPRSRDLARGWQAALRMRGLARRGREAGDARSGPESRVSTGSLGGLACKGSPSRSPRLFRQVLALHSEEGREAQQRPRRASGLILAFRFLGPPSQGSASPGQAVGSATPPNLGQHLPLRLVLCVYVPFPPPVPPPPLVLFDFFLLTIMLSWSQLHLVHVVHGVRRRVELFLAEVET